MNLPDGCMLRLVQGDITRIPVDAISNAANSALAGGGGVDGAVHRAGGPAIMAELDELRPRVGSLPPGQAVATGAGRLPASFVFHAVGPVYLDGRHAEPEQLASCYRACLAMAEERLCRSISFPSISTGVYGYPKEDAARIALREVLAFLKDNPKNVREVVLVQFGAADYAVYDRLLDEIGRL